MSCAHDWQPIPGAFQQYRCAACGVEGRRASRDRGTNKVGGPIVPYASGRCPAKSPERVRAEHVGAGPSPLDRFRRPEYTDAPDPDGWVDPPDEKP